MIDKVVIDTNIYISAIFWSGNPRKIVDLGRKEKILVFICSEIENEITEKLKTKFRLKAEEINQIVLDFSSFTIPVKISKRVQAVVDDPEDNKFIECAIASKAKYIISGDNHLLKLKRYNKIEIITARDYLNL